MMLKQQEAVQHTTLTPNEQLQKMKKEQEEQLEITDEILQQVQKEQEQKKKKKLREIVAKMKFSSKRLTGCPKT